MQRRVLGGVLTVIGFAGMFLATYLFMTGSGGKEHLLEVIAYMIAGACCFFSGINLCYTNQARQVQPQAGQAPVIEDVSPLQQQWRAASFGEVDVEQPVTK